MVTHIKFPHIGQFKNAIREVEAATRYIGRNDMDEPIYDPRIPLPVLDIEGTVKLHGTNAAIGYNPQTDELWLQSRSNVLTENADNMGFYAAYGNSDLRYLFREIPNPAQAPIILFGEWCGKGIQQTVAISKLPKLFVIFAVQVGEDFLPTFDVRDIQNRIFDIRDFGVTYGAVDFNKPEEVIPEFERVVGIVDQRCPVAAALGVEGPGEGLVWRITTPGWSDPRYWFKTKGEEHKVVETKVAIPLGPEMMQGIADFVSRTVTENRCKQAVQILREANKPADKTSTGDFIKWIVADIQREEADTIEVNQFDAKALNNALAHAAKNWYFQAIAMLT